MANNKNVTLKRHRWQLILFCSVITLMVVSIPYSKADLVFENETVSNENEVGSIERDSRRVAPKEDDRATLRSAISASEKLKPSKNIKLPTQLMESEMYSDAATSDASIDMASKSDLMRRERVRQELQNEDMLQQRLEEMRLKDEKKRSTEIANALDRKQEAAVVQTAPLQQEVVSDKVKFSQAQAVAVVDAENKSSADAEVSEKSDSVEFMVTPRVGIPTMGSDAYGGYYEVKGRYSVGVGIGVLASERIALEASYTYNEYGISPAGYSQIQPIAFEPLTLSQHIIDAGARLFLLGKESKIKPYIGASAGYARSSFSLSQSNSGNIYANQLMYGYGNYSRSYELDQFLGSLSTGLDISVAKNILVGAGFKYTAVLSATENNPAYSYLVPYNYYVQQSAQQNAGQSFARSGFYTIFGTVSFTF